MRAPMALRSTGARVALIAAAAALACGSAAGQTSSAQARGIIATQNTVSAGTCSDTSACVEINVVDKGSVTVTVGGVYTGALTGQVSADGTTWITLAPTPFTPAGAQTTPVATISSGATGSWQVGVAGWAKFRVTGLGAMTGAAVVVLQSSTVSTGGGGGGGAAGAITAAASALAAGAGVDGWDLTQGAKADAACASDTAACTAIALSKRIAQNLTSLNTTYSVTTATLTNVAASATNVTCLASNAARKGGMIVNDSASATLYAKYGATASATSYTYSVLPGGTLTLPTFPIYTGIIDCIWTAAVGNARVTEE